MDDLLHPFMMNQATPFLEAWLDFEKKQRSSQIAHNKQCACAKGMNDL